MLAPNVLYSADENTKMCGPNLGQLADIERGDCHSSTASGTQRAQKHHAELLDPDAQPSAASSIRLPESARGRRPLPRRPGRLRELIARNMAKPLRVRRSLNEFE